HISTSIVVHAMKWGAGTLSAWRIAVNSSGPLASLAKPCCIKPNPTINRRGMGAHRATAELPDNPNIIWRKTPPGGFNECTLFMPQLSCLMRLASRTAVTFSMLSEGSLTPFRRSFEAPEGTPQYLSSRGFPMHSLGRKRERTLRYLLVICIACFAASHTFGQRLVTFPLQGKPVEIQADLYGSGTRGVVLAHGGRFHKESWKKQAEALADAGFLVLAVRFRGDAFNPDGSPDSSGSTADNAADVL